MKQLSFILIFLCITTISYSAEYENLCHDQETWKDRDKLALKHPHDRDIQKLHAIRIGLCVKVEKNSITFEEATDLFNDMVDTMANKRNEGKERKGNN